MYNVCVCIESDRDMSDIFFNSSGSVGSLICVQRTHTDMHSCNYDYLLLSQLRTFIAIIFHITVRTIITKNHTHTQIANTNLQLYIIIMKALLFCTMSLVFSVCLSVCLCLYSISIALSKQQSH